MAESIGVTAEPELLRKELTEEDQFVVLVSCAAHAAILPRAEESLHPPAFGVFLSSQASDGVWEFLTNQSVADMILKFIDPLDACRAVRSSSPRIPRYCSCCGAGPGQVVAESYRLWLQYEVLFLRVRRRSVENRDVIHTTCAQLRVHCVQVRTDDITMILAFIDTANQINDAMVAMNRTTLSLSCDVANY